MQFREPPPKGKRASARKAADGQGAAAGKQRARRKAAEIAEDPIEDDDYDYEPSNFDFPDDVDGTAPTAAAAPNTRSNTQFTSGTTLVEDADDDVIIVDPPPSQPRTQLRQPRRAMSRDDVIEQCYLDLKRRRDKVSLVQVFL